MRHFIVNVIYTLNSIISLTLYYTGCRNKNKYHIFISFALSGVRNTLRMMDIEDTVNYMRHIEFVNLMIRQELGSAMFAIIFLILLATFFSLFITFSGFVF